MTGQIKKRVRLFSCIGILVGISCLLYFPSFVDTWFDSFIFFVIFSALLGVLSGFFAWIFRRNRKDSMEKEDDASFLRENRLYLILVFVFILSFVFKNYLFTYKVNPRLLLFGIDAARWYPMEPLLKSGEIPNIKELAKEGASGVLTAFEPISSSIIWTSISTGKKFSKHQVESFYTPLTHSKTKRIWEILQQNNMKVGVFKWVMTMAYKANGFIVPGIPFAYPTTYPKEYSFINELRTSEKVNVRKGLLWYALMSFRLARSGVRLSTFRKIGSDLLEYYLFSRKDVRELYYKRKSAELLLNKDLFIFLLKKYSPDFASFYDNGIDQVCHKYWKYYEPDYFRDVEEISAQDIEKYGNYIPEFYKKVDSAVHDILKNVGYKTTVIVISDHGQEAFAGYGKTVWTPKTEKLISLLGLKDDVYSIFTGTRYSHIQPKSFSINEREKILQKTKEALKNVRVEETGSSFFQVYPDDSQGFVKFIIRSSAIDFSHHVKVGEKVLKLKDIVYQVPAISGAHTLDGIIIVKGPFIKPKYRISSASVLDVTPTILYFMGLPVGEDMDGRVLDEIFNDDFKKIHKLSFIKSYDTIPMSEEDKGKIKIDPKIKERLKSMGYIQ